MELSEFHRMGLLLALLRAELHRVKLIQDLALIGQEADSPAADLLPSICYLLDPTQVQVSEGVYEAFMAELKRISALPLPEFLKQLHPRTEQMLSLLSNSLLPAAQE